MGNCTFRFGPPVNGRGTPALSNLFPLPSNVSLRYLRKWLVQPDWLTEQGLTYHQTHYRSYRGRFLQVIWPNQQCQSTEGNQLVFQIRLESHQDHSTMLRSARNWRKGKLHSLATYVIFINENTTDLPLYNTENKSHNSAVTCNNLSLLHCNTLSLIPILARCSTLGFKCNDKVDITGFLLHWGTQRHNLIFSFVY